MKKILIIIILIFLLLGGIFFAISLMNFQPTKQLAATSGIMGKIQKGPGCGTIRAGETMDSCYSPIIARVVVKDSNNNEITHFTSDVNGNFKVNLPPGEYILEPIAISDATSKQLSVKVEKDYKNIIINYALNIMPM